MGLLTILVTILGILIAMCHARPGSSRRINDPDRVSVPDEEVAQGLLQAKPTPATPSVQRHENTVGATVDRTVVEAGELAEGLARSGTARECQSHCQNGDAIFHCAFTGLDDPQLDPRLISLTIRHHQRIVCRDSATTTEIELSIVRMRTGPFEINYHK